MPGRGHYRERIETTSSIDSESDECLLALVEIARKELQLDVLTTAEMIENTAKQARLMGPREKSEVQVATRM